MVSGVKVQKDFSKTRIYRTSHVFLVQYIDHALYSTLTMHGQCTVQEKYKLKGYCKSVRSYKITQIKAHLAEVMGIKVYRCLLFWGKINVEERKYFTCPSWESNPGRWIYSQTLYHVAVKAGFYRKAVEVYYIDRPCDIHPLQFEIRP